MDHTQEQQLVKEGRFVEAAQAALGRGDHKQAAEHYAAAWEWKKATEVAIAGGEFALAFRCALESGDTAAVLPALAAHPAAALSAASVAEQKGRLAEAAKLRELVGDVSVASTLYEQAGDLKGAARCARKAGDERQAGMLFEKHLRLEPGDGEAALALGQILVTFGRYQPAAKALQKAAESEEQMDAALGLLVACFSAMRMDRAAESALSRLAARRAVPTRVDEFLTAAFGSEEGVVGLHKKGDGGDLLAGRYRIVKPLGAGASGRVLLGHDAFYDRQVAIKVLNVASGARGRDQYALFAREAQVAAGIDHPSVVRVFEFNADGPFLVMEYMAGGTLDSRLSIGGPTLPLATVRHVANSILLGLGAVHRRGVIHRDLKPANVFFGAAGEVKLGDFGVAHLQDLNSTMTGAMMGTLAFMSPEQVTGRDKPSAATDLYAFGVILFLLLTAQLPIEGPDFVNAHLSEAPKVPSKTRPNLGTRFDALIAALLEKEQKDRPQSTDEVRAMLDAINWHDDEENALERAIEYGRQMSAPEPKEASQEESTESAKETKAIEKRYIREEDRAHDTWLDRAVVFETCDATRAEYLSKAAMGDHPHLQAVYDREGQTFVLEDPKGETPRLDALSETQRTLAKKQLRDALESLHRAGVIHGSVAPSTIRISAGRAVLMLPRSASRRSVEDDLAALEELLSGG